MGTRADFYVGRGKDAEWLGSLGWDGYPDNDDYITPFQAKDEREWRLRVGELLAARDDATLPEHGWPWPWEDSTTTDWAYAIDGGTVYASCFGAPWVPVLDYLGYDDEKQDAYANSVPSDGGIEHPNMKAVQNVTLGRRSGVMLVDVGEEGVDVRDDKSELDEHRNQAKERD